MTNRAVTMLNNKLNILAQDDQTKILILEQSIYKWWQDVYELKEFERLEYHKQQKPLNESSYKPLTWNM